MSKENTQEPKKATPSHRHRFRHVIMYLSLTGAFLGFISALENLFPVAVRLSLLVKAIVNTYQAARDFVLNFILSIIFVEVPTIPPPWGDILFISFFMVAAANLELNIRFGLSVFGASFRIARSFFTPIEALQTNYPNDRFYKDLHVIEKKNFYTIVLVTSMIIVILLPEIDRPLENLCFILFGIYLFIVAGSILIYVLFDRIFSSILSRREYLIPLFVKFDFYFLFSIMIISFPFQILAVIMALYTISWRGIIIMISIIFIFMAANHMFIVFIDPVIIDPPPWLSELIDADPKSLRPKLPLGD